MRKILKKITAISLIVTMLLSLISISVIAAEDKGNTEINSNKLDTNSNLYFNKIFTDVNDNNLINVVGLLNSLGIMKGYEDNTFKPDKTITRAEFVAMMIRLLGIDISDDKEVEKEFIDVEKGGWATKSIYAGVAQGFIKGISDTEFQPENPITYEQSVKIIVSALGYDVLAQAKGGYPSGYLALAGEKKILKGINSSMGTAMKRSDIARLVYNSLDVDIMEITRVGKDVGYSVQKDKNILTERLKVFKAEGVIEGDYETALYDGDSNAKEDEVIINQKKYKVGITKANDLLGYSVEYYYKDFENGKGDTIINIYPTEDNDTVTINYDDFSSIDGFKLTYSKKNDNNKDDEESITLAQFVNIIFNGKSAVVDRNNTISSYLTGTNAFDDLKLIDNNSDGKYDVLFVNKYDTYVVKSVNPSNKNIVLEYPVKGNYNFDELDEEDSNKIIYILKDGDKITLKDIKDDDVLSVAESKDSSSGKKLYTVYVSSSVINGEVSEITNETNKKYKISEKEYEIAPELNSYLSSENRLPAINDKGKYYLNFKNKIAYVDIKNSSGKRYGYLFKAHVGSGIDPKVQIELFTLSSKFEVFDLADKIDITYYPRYTPWAIYYNVPEEQQSAYDTKTIPVLQSSVTVNKTAYLYLDPVIRNAKSLNASDVYKDTPDKKSAIDQLYLFREPYKERDDANKLVLKYFFIKKDNKYSFDAEKMKLVRYELDGSGKIKSIETAKDYGMPYQWRDQGEDTLLTEIDKDRDNDVFRVSVKSPLYRDPNTGARPLTSMVKNSAGAVVSGTEATLEYRFYANANAFYQNLKEWDTSIKRSYNGYTDAVNPNTSVSNSVYGVAYKSDSDQQPALFYLGTNAIAFNVPRTDATLNEFGFLGNDDRIQPINKTDIDAIRFNKSSYSIQKFNPTELEQEDVWSEESGITSIRGVALISRNYQIEAYNTDRFDATNLMVRNVVDSRVNADRYILVDKVVTVIDKFGDKVQKVYGYNNGKMQEFVGNNDTIFNRVAELSSNQISQLGSYQSDNNIAYGKSKGQPFKRGDYIAIKKSTFENGFDRVNQIFDYNSHSTFKLYRAGRFTSPHINILLSNLLNNTNRAYYFTQEEFKGINNQNGVKVSSSSNVSYGHISGNHNGGYFAGKLEDKNNAFIKMQFDEPINGRYSGDKVRFDRLNRKFQMAIDPKVMVYIVKENSIEIKTMDDINPSDFIVVRYANSKAVEIIKYEELTTAIPDRK